MREPVTFDRCIDIGEEHIAQAIVSRAAFAHLLDRAAEVAKPEEGGPKLLVALARLATKECNWLDGDLRIILAGNDEGTRLVVIHHTREVLFSELILNVPFDEFVRAVRLVPKLIAPLTASEDGEQLVLSATESVRKTSIPPAPSELSAASKTLLDRIPKFTPKDRPSRRPTVARLPAIRFDVHNKPTVARMAAIRPEDLPEARREDQADIDEAWSDDDSEGRDR